MKKVIKEQNVDPRLVEALMGAISSYIIPGTSPGDVRNAIQTAIQQHIPRTPGTRGAPLMNPLQRENKMKLSIKELRSMIREAIEECGYMDEMGEGGAMEEESMMDETYMDEESLKRDELKEAVERKKAERAEMNKRITEKDLSVTVAQLRAVASLSDKQKEKFMDCIKDGHSVAAALRKCK